MYIGVISKGETKMARHWTDELDIPINNADGTWTDLETGFVYNADGSLRTKRKPRQSVPARVVRPVGTQDDKALAKAVLARIKKTGVTADIAAELAAYRMPALVLIARKITGRETFENKAAAVQAIVGA